MKHFLNKINRAGWVNVTLEKMIPYNIEEFPLHIRITSNELDKSHLTDVLVPILYIEFQHPNNGNDPTPPSFILNYWPYYHGIWAEVKDCGDYFRSPIDEIPLKGTEYVVEVTSESLLVTRNGTEVTSVYFADYGSDCEKIWSRNKVWIKFKDNWKLEYRPHFRGELMPVVIHKPRFYHGSLPIE